MYGPFFLIWRMQWVYTIQTVQLAFRLVNCGKHRAESCDACIQGCRATEMRERRVWLLTLQMGVRASEYYQIHRPQSILIESSLGQNVYDIGVHVWDRYRRRVAMAEPYMSRVFLLYNLKLPHNGPV